MTSLIEMMRQRLPTDADAAARRCPSRQAYSQAIKRGRFSNETALRCAYLLNIDRAAALLANCPAAEYLPSPVEKTASYNGSETAETLPRPTPTTTPPALYYVKSDSDESGHDADQNDIRKNKNNAAMHEKVHSLFSSEQQEAIDLIRWVYAVARLPADSPRFAWYVSRWAVPDKIARAKAAGTFENSIRNCPPIDPAWIRLVPAALEECHRFSESIKLPAKRASSPEKQTPRNNARRVA